MIIDEINSTLKNAMKEGNKDQVLAIRNILGRIKKVQVDSQKELKEDEIIAVINKYAKQLRDSIEQFKSGNRLDLVEKENEELKIVQTFLPTQLSKEEIQKLTIDVIEKLNANSMADMGKVMKEIMNITKGSADGKLISVIVREELK